MDTFSGQQLYDAYHEDYDAITDRDARIYDHSGNLLVTGHLLGLRFDDPKHTGKEVIRYRFGSMSPEVPWDRSHRIDLAPR
jgi:hypothetical protein